MGIRYTSAHGTIFQKFIRENGENGSSKCFSSLWFLGGVCRASEIYIEKSIWNDDQAVYEVSDYGSVLYNSDSDWYLKGCNTLYMNGIYPYFEVPRVALMLSDLTFHVELGERNLNEAILGVNFFGDLRATMALANTKWDITVSPDLKPGRYLLFTNTESFSTPLFHISNWNVDDNPCIEAEYDDASYTWLSIYYNHLGSQVPEPGAAGLSLLGITAALWRRRRE